MGAQIIRQPDGWYAVFSSETDTITAFNRSAYDIGEMFALFAAENARERVAAIIAKLDDGHPEQAYFQFALTWEEARAADREHGGALTAAMDESERRKQQRDGDLTPGAAWRERLLAAAKQKHDERCNCDPRYLMSCPRMAQCILDSGIPPVARQDSSTPPPTHPYAGTDSGRQSRGDPGHCEDCAQSGHVRAHPDLGCGDVGCNRHHPPGMPGDQPPVPDRWSTPRRRT